MDKRELISGWSWKIALGAIIVLVPTLLTKISGALDVKSSDVFEYLLFGVAGVTVALGVATVLFRVLRHLAEEKFASKPPSESHTRQF